MVKEGFKKFRVIVKEEIVHIYEVEEFNEFMAKEAGLNCLKVEQAGRIKNNKEDISVQEIKV